MDPSQRKTVEEYIQKAKEEGAEVYQCCACIPSTGCYYPPTMITNVQPVSTVVQEEVGRTFVTLLGSPSLSLTYVSDVYIVYTVYA